MKRGSTGQYEITATGDETVPAPHHRTKTADLVLDSRLQHRDPNLRPGPQVRKESLFLNHSSPSEKRAGCTWISTPTTRNNRFCVVQVTSEN